MRGENCYLYFLGTMIVRFEPENFLYLLSFFLSFFFKTEINETFILLKRIECVNHVNVRKINFR